MNDIRLLPESALGSGFVPPEFIAPGADEYTVRDEQLRALGKDPSSFRRIKPFEIEILVKNHNTCQDWNQLLVTDPFQPELVRNSAFAGLVRLGRIERGVLEHHDTRASVGVYNSRVIACDIGDDCAVLDCSYLAHYIVGDGCMLLDNDEIECSNHAKFGNGVLREGEPEEVRIELDLMNEAGGRSVLPFDGMNAADAYLWARRRGDAALMAAFRRMTDAMHDPRRGRYGEIGHHSVLKSNRIVKDVKVGPCAYIKGANKLKNLTVNSSEEARTQIGEGVEMVNGIVGYGCRIFYGVKAVRFVLGDNSGLKYGARLIHSLLGANSTVSCCEILNNLIFPAHEQHHNTSFLIASLVRGQSNMAAGATIGSNHNSRANDGEIEAGRGFWPGLSSSVKHSSRFASYTLLAKGDYRWELDLPLPFCLVDDDRSRERLVIVPAYWWTHNLYALLRNESKFIARDHRAERRLLIEFSPFAPDTAEEIVTALGLLETWTGRALAEARGADPAALAGGELATTGRAALAGPADEAPPEVEAIGVENSSRSAVAVKPARAWAAYREMLLWYAAGAVVSASRDVVSASRDVVSASRDVVGASRDGAGAASGQGSESHNVSPGGGFAALEARLGNGARGADGLLARERAWENLGGQLVPLPALDELLARAARGGIPTWREMHAEYLRLGEAYPLDKARHAWAILEWLHGAPLDAAALRGFVLAYIELAARVEEGIYRSRKKDYENRFRRATFRSEAEMEAVVGRPERNAFVLRMRGELSRRREEAAACAAAL